MKIRYILLALLILSASIISAQSNKADYAINLKTATIIPDANVRSFIDSYNSLAENVFQNQFYKIVQFYDIPSNKTKESLYNAGISLLDYLPNKAYIAVFSSDFDKNSEALRSIRSIIEIKSQYKCSQLLFDGNYPDYAMTDDGAISVIASYFQGLDPQTVREIFLSNACAVIDQNDFSRTMILNIQTSDIEKIASLPVVLYLEPIGSEPIPENYTGRTLHRGNAIATNYTTGRHYDGSGVVVELQDDGLIGPHIDYQGRIAKQFPTNNEGNHGDHCAGILIGAGNLDPMVKGTASGSVLYVYNAPSAYPGFNNIPEDYENFGIRITSTSYSDGCNTGYNYRARMLDQQVREFPSLMHVFSAGNDGNSNCGYGAGPGWGNITGGHKTGKNVITVGLVGWDDDLSDMSSRGPAPDGRLKPDLVGKGRDVYSTINPNTYAYKTGTSMSCPAVAGTFAQLYQAYREYNSGQDPKSELMKSILLNTADDLGNPGPDFKFGYGRINALRAVKVIEENRFVSGAVNQGDKNSYDIEVPAGLGQLKIMVSWTDYPAVQFSDWTLVNNLNMTLNDPSSNIWRPWKLSHYPDPDSLDMPAFRGVDDRNNVEQITLDNPQAGIYTVNIDGFSIPEGPQEYSIVWEFITEDVILTYPVGGESLVPGEQEVIRWDASGNEGTFLLEISMDNGANWHTIADNLPGEGRHYSWNVPAGNTGKALMRITKGASVSTTEAPFSIFGVPCGFEVDWACGDLVHLSWNPVMGANSYEIMALGEKVMEPLTRTTKTSVIVTDSNTATNSWFSVRAIGDNGAVGRRAIALERTKGSYNCKPNDVMMEEIPTAAWGIYQNASMNLSLVKVEVLFRNYGTETISNIPLKYMLGNNEVVSETYLGAIEPDESVLFQFSKTIDISSIGNYTIKAWAEYPEDDNPENDLLEKSFEVIEGTTVPLGTVENFDSWAKCTAAPACEAISCILDNGWINLDNAQYDEHDWRVYSGSTPSPFTGPQNDHTSGTASGHYLYMEPSLYCLNKSACINSPCINLANGFSPGMTLWYNSWGPDIGQFHVDLFDGETIIEDICPPLMGNKGDEWKELEIDLMPWANKIIALRFRGITSCGEYGDFAIDDISLSKTTGLEDDINESDPLVSIFPNPTNSSINVSFTGKYAQKVTINIEDIYGRIIWGNRVEILGDELNTTINISSFSKGMYFISGHDDSGKILFWTKVMKL